MLLLLLISLLAGPVAAQPPPPLPQGQEIENSAADDAEGEGPDAGREEPDVRRVYVPTSELNALLSRDREGVLLPRDEFRDLYEAAKAAEEDALHTPAGIVVTSASYVATVGTDEEQLRLTAQVNLRQFDPGWQIVRLPVGGLSVQSVALDDQPAAAARDGKQRNLLLVFVDSPGEQTLTLELTTPLKSVGSDTLAEFQTLGAPAGNLTLTLPEGKSLLVDGLRQTPAAEGENTFRISLGGRPNVSLRLTDRDLRHAADALVFARTAYGLQVAPGEVTWNTRTSVQAYGQSLNQVTFTVPGDLEVAAVESTGLEEWTLGETGRGRRRRTSITLDYRQPFEGERTVTIRGVLVPESENWTVPNLMLQDADSHAATILVRHGPEVRLTSEHGEEVRPVSGQTSRTLEFRTMDPAFDLQFRTLGKQRSVQVAMTNMLDVSDDGLDLQTVMDVETYFVSLFDVRVTLPADFEVTGAVVGETPVEWTVAGGAAGINEVRIPLATPVVPGEPLRVSLMAHADPEDWPVENAPVLLGFPEVGLPQASMVEARYGIMADADLDIRTSELTGLDPARQADVEGLQKAARQLGKELRLGFSYQDTVFSGQLEVTRKPTHLAVSTLSLSRLDPQTVHTGLQAFITVEGGGTEGLLIELPEQTGTDLRFTVQPMATPVTGEQQAERAVTMSQPVAIVEQTVSEPAAGVRTWALKFDRRMRGNHLLRVTLNQPRQAGADTILPAVTFTGAERQNGWIAVEARPEQNLQVSALSAQGQPLLRVDPVDLPGMGEVSDQRRIVAGVRYVRPGYAVTVSEQSFAPASVPTALADRMSTTSVLSETGLLQHQLDVTFRAVGMQSLRFALPQGADVWAVLIDGAPVEVRQVRSTYQVPLASVDDPSAARTLRLIYRSRIGKTGITGRLRQSPPVLAALSGSGQPQPLEVLEQNWTLHYPRDLVLLGSHGLFAPVSELTVDSWLDRLRESVTLPTLAQASWRIGIAGVIALVVACVVVFVRRFGLRPLLVVVTVSVVGLLLIALLLPATQQAREAARRTQEVGSAGAEAPADLPATDMAAPVGENGAAVPQRTPLSQFESESPQEKAPPTAQPDSPFGAMDDAEAAQMPQAGTPIGQAQQAAPAGQVGEPAAGLVAGRSDAAPAPSARGALLSLSLDLQAPDDARLQEFQTLATDVDLSLLSPDPSVLYLDVSYGSRSFREVIALCLAAGLVLLMWWLRHSSWKCRLGLVLATIVVPLALAPIAPAWGTMIVEGVLLGGIAGTALWILLAIVKCLASACARWCPPGWSARPKTSTTTALLVAASLLTTCRFALAQEEASRMVESEIDTGSQTAQGPKANPKPDATIRDAGALPTVVVPYEGDDPLAAERVFLPQKLFRQLWLKANPDQRPKSRPPTASLVTEALYVVDLSEQDVTAEAADSKQVNVRGRFVLFGFGEAAVWQRLPLDEVAVTSATIDGEPAILRPGAKGRPHVLIDSPGLHVLDLEFELPAELRQTSGELTLPLQPVPSGSLSLTLPGSEQPRQIRVRAGQQIVGSRISTTEQGHQQMDVAIDQGGPLRITWQPAARSGGEDNIVHVDSQTALEIGDAGVQLVADYRLQVRQGLLSEVPFRFPESVRLKRITGADVGGWQIEGEGDDRTLTIFLRRNVDDATTLTAELFVPQEDRSDAFDLDVPSFAPLQVTRETGEVAILAGEYLDVRTTRAEGLRQIDRGDVRLPAALAEKTGRVQSAYRFVMRGWDLSLSVRPSPPEASASAEHGVSIGPRKARYVSRFQFDLAGAPRQTLTILLTDTFLLTNVTGEGIDDWFVEGDELTIDFGQPRVGPFELVLEGHMPREPDDDEALIITPLPRGLDRQQSRLAVWVDPMYSASLVAFDTWRTIDREQLPGELRRLQSTPPQFAFHSSAAEPEIINLDLIRQQPQLTGDAVALIAVSDVSVDYGLTLRWTIERAATDTLVFSVPDWLQDRLELRGEAIRQTTQTLTDDGRVRWSVQLTDAVRGQYLLSAIATLPPPEEAQVAAPDIVFEQPPTTSDGPFTTIEAQQTFAVLVNLSQGRLSPAGDYDSLTARRSQLPLVLRDDLLAQAMAIVRKPPRTEVVWNLQRVTEQTAQAAQVSAAELTSVLALDGSVRTRARYRVRNRGQQFLALDLPESARVLSVLVKGEPARGLSASIGELPVTLIPLPQTSAADLSFVVELVLADRLPGVQRLDAAALGRVIDLPVPQVISTRQSAEFGMPVVYTSLTVQLPEQFDAEIVPTGPDGEPRSNLTPQPAQTARAMTQLQLYRELEDLNRLVIDKSTSFSQRKKAASNIDALQKQLSGERSSRSSLESLARQLAPADRQFAIETDEVLEESLRNVQQAEQELQHGGQVSPEDPGTANYFGKEFIIGNSMSIISDNTGRGVEVSEGRLNTLGLRSDGGKADAAAKGPARPTDSRAQLRGKLQSQMLPAQRDFTEGQAAPGSGSRRGIGGGGLPAGDPFARQAPVEGAFDFFRFDAQISGPDPDLSTASLPGVPQEWLETGGLSLPIDVPEQKQSLTFTKLGGDPKLALNVRPRQTGTSAIRWAWAIIVLLAGAWLLHHLAHQRTIEQTRNGLIVAAIALGLIGLLGLPLPLNLFGGILFATGLVFALLHWQAVGRS